MEEKIDEKVVGGVAGGRVFVTNLEGHYFCKISFWPGFTLILTHGTKQECMKMFKMVKEISKRVYKMECVRKHYNRLKFYVERKI